MHTYHTLMLNFKYLVNNLISITNARCSHCFHIKYQCFTHHFSYMEWFSKMLHFFTRWRVFLTTMCISRERAIVVVLAACAMHNFLRTRLPTFTNSLLDKEDPETHQVTPGQWRQETGMKKVQPLRGNTALAFAKKQRESLCSFVNGAGSVSWQDNILQEWGIAFCPEILNFLKVIKIGVYNIELHLVFLRN